MSLCLLTFLQILQELCQRVKNKNFAAGLALIAFLMKKGCKPQIENAERQNVYDIINDKTMIEILKKYVFG